MKFLIPQFSFFEFIGILTFGTIVSNYFLDRPLINITIFMIYCVFAGALSSLNFYLRYKSNVVISD
ncbi:hypothetical protein F892_03661 [Acinetobacter vivianii]|jgi:uncharacterized membrane protein YcaP (DUF421 family)|uniref:Uncharacterized protein n=1 Tax=Acinetobacter vivianii TaxID=1776742 RepID=N9NEW1_9GAMM|nr:hypothetical protein F892_03661 [Acinetobacter vivianii]GGI60209.1 hypothetical protein GCM10011446_17040 [Acinetobacter vivianii]